MLQSSFVSSIVTEGLLDTNLFIHAHLDDTHSDECRRFLEALQRGERQARLEVLVVHELSYVFPRVVKQFDRHELARYLISVIEWPGVVCERATIAETLQRWSSTPGLSFIDAYLATVATTREVPIYTKNVRELIAQGVDVPVPLPS